jgi:hypothetical protein
MKKYGSITQILTLACACLISTGCATNQTASSGGTASVSGGTKNGAHLLVYRVANFGSNLSLVLAVDGRDVSALTEGRQYDGYLSPGSHVLSARIDPNPGGVSPWQKTMTVKNGQTYSFTASWSGQSLVLVRNQ